MSDSEQKTINMDNDDDKTGNNEQKQDIPKEFLCPITREIFSDPVITIAGVIIYPCIYLYILLSVVMYFDYIWMYICRTYI